MIELLEWAQLLNDLASQQAEPSVSNALVFLYAMAYIINRKGCFITAFILCEFLADGPMLVSLPNSTYYLVMASVYSLLYCHCFYKSMPLKNISGCVIMVSFQIWMSIDAKAYNGNETFVYENYIYIIVFIHLYIIGTLFNWSRIRRSMGDNVRGFMCMLRSNDTISFFWYTTKKTFN
tara:strand:+ start:1059 stop:1592 length:534 start_codon:yes stop_codon:yes gene_type:complete